MSNHFHGITHITPSDGNIFEDLGFPPDEAAQLLAETDRMILERIAIKESLMAEIAAWIASEGLNQVEVAHVLGITKARVSDVINTKTGDFSIDTLVNLLIKAGKQVRFSTVN